MWLILDKVPGTAVKKAHPLLFVWSFFQHSLGRLIYDVMELWRTVVCITNLFGQVLRLSTASVLGHYLILAVALYLGNLVPLEVKKCRSISTL